MIPTKKLCKVIEKSLEEQNLDKLNVFLSSTNTSEAFNCTTLSTLGKMLKKIGKHEDKILHADCVLSCLQHFVDNNLCSYKWEMLANDIGKLCELVFVISATYIKNETLIQKNISTFMAIVDHRKVMADSMLRFTMSPLLKAVSADVFSNSVRLVILTLISSMMSRSSRELRREITPLQHASLEALSNSLFVCGDYETQVAIVEVLARCWYYLNDRGHVKADLFSNFPNIMEMFKTYSFLNLDAQCRLFLNDVNNGMGENQLVYSIPCLVVSIDNMRYKKPSDPIYKEFWVDFNVSSRTISFYYQTNPEESWELMTVFQDNIVDAKAVNSACKVKSGQVISAVKIEIALKIEETNAEGPKLLKIYPRKCKEFEKLEKNAIRQILPDKYKTDVTYDELYSTSEAKLTPTQQHPKSSECKPVQEDTLATLNSTLILKRLDESGSEKSGMASLTSRTTVIEQTINESRDDSKDSDSFSRYIKQLKKQDNNKNIQSKDQNEADVPEDTPANEDEEESNLDRIQAIAVVGKSLEMSLGSKEMEINDKKTSESYSGGKNLESLKKSSTLNKDISKGKLGKSGSHETNRTHTIKTVSDLLRNSNNSKRRRLFSSENNNLNDIVLSSQEEFSAEIPEYKLQKKEEPKIKPQPNVDRKNITYSYLSDREKVKQKQSDISSELYEDKVLSDVSDSEMQRPDSKKNIEGIDRRNQKEQSPNTFIPSFKSVSSSEKNLLALNETPKSAKKSDMFPSKSIYSDLFSSGKDTHFKRTYARPKQVKRKTKLVHLLSSDSDSDYIPSKKVSPVIVPRKAEKRTNKKWELNLERFVKNLPSRVDPTRNVESMDVMEIEPANRMELDAPRDIEMCSAVKPDEPVGVLPQKGRGRKGNAAGVTKKSAPKKVTDKVQKAKNVQTRKPRGKKVLECIEKSIENVLREASTSLEVINYNHPEANEACGEDSLALDILGCQMSQESNISEASPESLMLFGKHCLTEASNRIRNALTLTQKEREMHFSTYSFKAHASFSALQEQNQKLLVVSNNLLKVKSLLDSTAQVQQEVYTQIQTETTQLEEARQLLVENISKIEKTQSSRIVTIFQELRKYMNNFAMSFFQRSAPKRALQN